MKKLLEKLLSGEGKLSLMLLEARQYSTETKDEKFGEFLDREINGYVGVDLPEYRKIRGEIIGTITDSFGQIVKQSAINFSKLSDAIGLDLATVQMVDGIGFIEDILSGLSGNLALRPIPSQMVEMLNKTFKLNNPGYNLIKASHEISVPSMQFILTKVRQELILNLQRLQTLETSESPVAVFIESVPNEKKSVFVTYAWENEEHNDKVISFVDFLRKNGYNALMDRKISQEETSINLNKMMIEGIQNSEKVIIVLSPKYKMKADNFTGGVGTEFQMIFEELKTNANKFIFVSFGNHEFKNIAPTGIAGREVLDLKKDQDENFNSLFAKLESKNIIQFSDVNEVKPEVKIKEIKPFKL